MIILHSNILRVSALLLMGRLMFCTAFLPSFMQFGRCGSLDQMSGFDLEKYSGIWYFIMEVPNEFVQEKHCVFVNYTIQDGHLESLKEGLLENRTRFERVSLLDIPTDDDSTVSFISNAPKRPSLEFMIYDTDYNNYACMYACLNRFTFKAEFVWVLSRFSHVDKENVEKCKTTVAESSNFDWNRLVLVEQGESCPYWKNLTDNRKHLKLEETISEVNKLSAEVDAAINESIRQEMVESDTLDDLVYDEVANKALPTHLTRMLQLLICCQLVVLFGNVRKKLFL